MKRTLPILLCLALVFAEYSARAPEPKPQFETCVMTWCALGLFGMCMVACYWHAWSHDYSGPTNSPPLIKTNLPPLSTNSIPTNALPPLPPLDATGETERLDVSASNWVDSAGFSVSALYRTTIETATSPAGPWGTAYVVTLWESAYGDTMLVDDGAGNGLSTNYTPKAANGSVTNRATMAIELREPCRFWRAKL